MSIYIIIGIPINAMVLETGTGCGDNTDSRSAEAPIIHPVRRLAGSVV